MSTYDPTQPFAIKRCRHGLFAFSRNDTFIGRSLDTYGEWCEFELDLLRSVVGVNDTVIDVGANIGTHVIAFARMAKKVYAFEPQPRLYRMLQANLALNNIKHVTTHRLAVGAYCGDILIADLPSDETVFNFGALPISFPGPNRLSAQMVTIDSLGLSPALIKIDVEGMESDVIEGAKETIKRHSPVIYLENNGNDSDEAAGALNSIGYRAWWSIGPYFNPNNFFKHPTSIWSERMMPSANLIAVPKSSGRTFDLPEFTGAADNWRPHYGTNRA